MEMERIIPVERSIMVAADVPNLAKLAYLTEAMVDVDGVSSVKLGYTLGFQNLAEAVQVVKETLGRNFPVVYDHQKAGNDIPKTGKAFAQQLKSAGVDAAILFPFAGPKTQRVWTEACLDAGLHVLTGGIMTHEEFLVSEGGYIADDAPERIYRLAAQLGVRHFVVPGNKIYWVHKIRAILVEELGEGNFVLYAPGFIDQRGDISECALAAGKEWHAIVGTAIYEQPNQEQMRRAAMLVASQIIS